MQVMIVVAAAAAGVNMAIGIVVVPEISNKIDLHSVPIADSKAISTRGKDDRSGPICA